MDDYQAVQITEPGRLELVPVTSTPLKPGMARLRMETIGICASDVAVLKGAHPFAHYPVISGHEMCGIIEEVEGAGPYQVGQRVAVEPMVACGQCSSCNQGHPNRCDQVQVMGIQLQGGMAQCLEVNQTQLHPVPPMMDAEMAAMIEPTAVAVHVCNRSKMKEGDRIAVVGTGKIGLLILAVAKARGASALFGVDVVPARLDHAKRMGAQSTALNAEDSALHKAREAAVEGFDAVFDTAGEPGSLLLATQIARTGGTVVPLALPHQGFPMDFRPFYRKELTLRAARMYNVEFQEATELLASGSVAPRSLITHRLPLAQAVAGFELAANHPDQAVKVIIQAQEAQSIRLGTTSSREFTYE